MSAMPTDQKQHVGSSEARQARLALLGQLQEARTRRLAHVAACLADPVFRATTAPDDVAMLESHQAALEKIIVLIERQHTDTQSLVKDLEQAYPPIRKPVRGLYRYLVWRWSR